MRSPLGEFVRATIKQRKQEFSKKGNFFTKQLRCRISNFAPHYVDKFAKYYNKTSVGKKKTDYGCLPFHLQQPVSHQLTKNTGNSGSCSIQQLFQSFLCFQIQTHILEHHPTCVKTSIVVFLLISCIHVYLTAWVIHIREVFHYKNTKQHNMKIFLLFLHSHQQVNHSSIL